MQACEVEDGWLVGVDKGEFGGGLWWRGKDSQELELLWQENVHFLMPNGPDFLVLYGIAHLALDTGGLLRVVRRAGQWSVDELAVLDGSPAGLSWLPDGRLLIVTNNSVARVTTTGDVETLHRFRLGGLYPNSVVEDKTGTIWVGMRQFVLRLVDGPDGPRQEWLYPAECDHEGPTPDSCCCAGD